MAIRRPTSATFPSAGGQAKKVAAARYSDLVTVITWWHQVVPPRPSRVTIQIGTSGSSGSSRVTSHSTDTSVRVLLTMLLEKPPIVLKKE